MSTIAFVAGPDPGHVLPVLGVARAVRARGHDTVVATGTQHEAHVRAEGHTFLELPLLASTPLDGDFAHVVWRRAGEMARPLHALLEPLRPAIVVTDTITTVGIFVADLLDVPWVEVVPHHLVDPDPAIAPVGLGADPARGPVQRVGHNVVRRAQRRSLAAGHRLRDEVRRGIGLGPHTAPAARLLQTLPGLEPLRTAWPPDARVVGAIALDPPLPALAPPPGDGPLVVATDSTADGLPAPLGEAALAAFGVGFGSGARLVVTTGRTDLVAPPGTAVGRAPHEPLLDEAAAAVTPGGGGFTAKALSRGVPLVVIPLAGDQRETAARVRRAGAGIWLPPRRATPARLAAAVRELLEEPSYRAAARSLGAGAAELGRERAAAIVEDVLARTTAG